MQSFIVVASLILELVGGQNDPPLGTNISKNTLGFLGLSSHLVRCFLGMLPGDSEDSDRPIRTLKCLSSAGTNFMGLAVRLCESLFHFCQYHH